ncbi:MAG: transcription antitermination factor NusB [bacterium]|nr:transcription antitermination factor NusB [bacterium]
MKTPHDPRHRWRLNMFKLLYQYSFQPDNPEISQPILPIIKSFTTIDKMITKHAPEWPLDKINKVDLAILRLAVYELLTQHAPYKVIIDEAVEIAKQYGSDRSHAFINGVLGQIVSQEKLKLITVPHETKTKS